VKWKKFTTKIIHEGIMNNISLGMMLSSLREQKGLTQDDIASQIYVCKAVIVDIENDQMIDVPFVFLKGYIRSYADLVGLSIDEYQPFIDLLAQQYMPNQVTNHLLNPKKKKRSKWLLCIIMFTVVCILGITIYFVSKESRSNIVEVSHYISPSSNHINS
jgi:Uncharacterized protein conserved in bacteria